MPDDVLGTDLMLAGDLGISSTGDLQMVSGVNNLKQRIVNRILTLKDDYYFGDFGSTVKSFVDAVDADITNKIQQAVSSAILEEPNIAQITGLNVTQNGSEIDIDVSAISVTGDAVQFSTSVGGVL